MRLRIGSYELARRRIGAKLIGFPASFAQAIHL